jgi:hypothetical protein
MKTTKLKQFVLKTTSESCDHYTYFIEHPKKPTDEEIERFLMEHANDKEEEDDGEMIVYESCDSIQEIKPKKFLTIPTK